MKVTNRAPEGAAAPSRVQMKKSGDDYAELLIYSEIDNSGSYGVSARDVIAALNEAKGVKRLDVRINSGGGDVFDGIAIYEALRRFPAHIKVHVDGLAASAASVIAMAGDERAISLAGFFMVHKASGLVYGDDEDMRKMASILEGITNQITAIYAERTGADPNELAEMVAAETWLNAQDSLAKKFATEIVNGPAGQASSQAQFSARIANAQRAFESGLRVQAMALKAPEIAAPPPPDNPAAVAPTNQAPSEGPFFSSKKGNTHMNRESELLERRETATINMEKIKNVATEEGRGLSKTEIASIEEIDGELAEIENELNALRKVKAATERLAAPLPRKGVEPAAQPRNGLTTVIGPVSAKRTDGGFTGGFAEFATAVKNVYTGGNRDERLFRAAESTYGAGATGVDGGFAIPEDFRQQIQSNALDQDPLIQRCFQIPTNSRQVTMPTHEAQPWSTDSVREYWTGEGSAIPRSKFAMSQVTIQLHKIAVLSFVTEELLEDAPALNAALSRDAAGKINFAVSSAIVRGTGNQQPLGFLNAPALATVAAESAGSSQTADTIVVENIAKMYAAMPPRNRGNAVWLIHPDAEAQLWIGAFHRTADPIGHAPGTLPNSPFGTLYGRPVIPHEVCETVGDLGDIMFVDLSDYALAMKAGGIKAQTSMHMAFDQDLMAFKFTMRCGGAPLWQGPIDSRDGSFDRSPFVVLAAR